MNKASGDDRIPAELFKMLKDDTVNVLHSIVGNWKFGKFGKLSSGHRTEKVGLHSNPKEGQCQRMFKLLDNCANFTY